MGRARSKGRRRDREGSRLSGEFSTEEWVTVFQSRAATAEIESMTIRGMLEASGIPSIVVRENVPELPTGRVSVRVFASKADEARQLIQQTHPDLLIEPIRDGRTTT